MALGKAKDKWPNPAREKRSQGKEARRIARREQEAEDWAQARLQGSSCDPMPTNKSGLDYLIAHYPQLVDSEKERNRKHVQETQVAVVTDASEASGSKDLAPNTNGADGSRPITTSTPLMLQDASKQQSSDLAQENENTSTLQTPGVCLDGSHDLNHKDGDKHGAISLNSNINLSQSLPTTTSIASQRSSYASALTSKAPPAKALRVAVPKFPINKKVDNRSRQIQTSRSVSTNALTNNLSEGPGRSSTAPLHNNVLAQGISAIASKQESWKVPTPITNRSMGSTLPNQQDLKKHSGAVSLETNRTVQPLTKNGCLSPNELQALRNAHGEGTVQSVQKASQSPQKSLAKGIPARILSEAIYRRAIAAESGNDESISIHQIDTEAPRVVLPPAEGDLRIVSKTVNTSSANVDSLPYSPRTQALRATAPTFIPHGPTIDNGDRLGSIYPQSSIIASSLMNASEPRLRNGSTQSITASSGTNGRRAILPVCLPESSLRPRDRFDSVPQSSTSAECRCDVGFPAYYRSISIGPAAPVNVQSDTTNAEYLSGPNDSTLQTARAVFALEVARRNTGLTAEQLMSFLAIRVPSVDPLIKFPRIIKAVYSKQEFPHKCDLLRYFTPVPQRTHDPGCPYANGRSGATGEGTHDAKSDEKSANTDSKGESEYGARRPSAWQAEDFQGFRVVPKELKLAEEGYDLLVLAKEARISLRRPGSEGYSREQQEQTPANGRNTNGEHQDKDIYNGGFANPSGLRNNVTSSPLENAGLSYECAVPGQEIRDAQMDTNHKVPRDYKELAAMSDVDTIASENGEHANDEFFVSRPVKNPKKEQTVRDNLNIGVVSNPTTPLPAFNTHAQTPATSYSDNIHQHHLRQMSAIHQGQHLQYPGPYNSAYFPQLQSPQHLAHTWAQQSSAFQHQLPMDPHWQWQWQHAVPHLHNNHQHAPLYLMNGIGGSNMGQGYPHEFWMVQQQHGQHGRTNPEHYGHGGS